MNDINPTVMSPAKIRYKFGYPNSFTNKPVAQFPIPVKIENNKVMINIAVVTFSTLTILMMYLICTNNTIPQANPLSSVAMMTTSSGTLVT